MYVLGCMAHMMGNDLGSKCNSPYNSAGRREEGGVGGERGGREREERGSEGKVQKRRGREKGQTTTTNPQLSHLFS